MRKHRLEDREVGTSVDELGTLMNHQTHLAVEGGLDGVVCTVALLGDFTCTVAGVEQ